MYPNPYGFTNAGGGAPNFNAAPPQNPHMQAGPAQNQQMMYNPQQQYLMGAQGAGFPGGPNPSMLASGAGPAALMQSTAAMPHMATNGQMNYYTNPSQPQLAPNYMMPTTMPQFQMNPAVQQPIMQQRMHVAQPNASVVSPQRQFNLQGTPTGSLSSNQPAHYSSPQAQIPPPSHTSSNTSQGPPSAPSLISPQTPTFPITGHAAQVNGTAGGTPLSPKSELREKERFSLLLEINSEILHESILLHYSRNEFKREREATESVTRKKELEEQEKPMFHDYTQCMRRLQTNLSYMASVADRKAAARPPLRPQFLTAPTLLSLGVKLNPPSILPSDPADTKGATDPKREREERDRYLKQLYKKLQLLYPDADPNQEPTSQGQRPGAALQPGQQAGGRGLNEATSLSPTSTTQVQGQATPKLLSSPSPAGAPAGGGC